MQKDELNKCIKTISGDIERMQNTVSALGMTSVQMSPQNYETLSQDAAMRAESIAVKLRYLVFASTPVQRLDYLMKAAEEMKIELCLQDGILKILMPGLLPKRKWKNTEFITAPLMSAMGTYVKENPVRRYQECVVCFAHIYNRSFPERRIRDHDNLECKQILDVISTFVLTDDTGRLCDTFHSSELGEEDRTEIYVMEKEGFLAWFSEREQAQKRGGI